MATPEVGQQVRVSIPRWLATNRGLPGTELEGRITFVTEKQVRLAPRSTSKEVWLPLSVITVAPLNGQAAPVAVAELPNLAERKEADPRSTTRTSENAIRGSISVRTSRGRAIVRAPFACKDALKAIPGATWDKDARAWTYPATPSAAANLVAAFPDLGYDTAFQALIGLAGQQERAQEHKTADALPPIPGLKTDAWLHQRQAYWFIEKLPSAMLAMGMGTGKSLVAVAKAVNIDAQKILILCPKSVMTVWPKQFETHTDHFVHCVPLTEKLGTVRMKQVHAAQQLEMWQSMRTGPHPVAIIVNYESAWRDPLAKWLREQQWDLLVLDESHKLKSAGGVASMYVSKLAKHASQRLALTGTPMPHNPSDVYAQYRALDPGIYGTNFSKFKLQYFDENPWTMKLEVKPSLADELNAKFYSIAYRVSADVLDLPEAVHIDRYCSLDGEGQRVYQDLENSFYAEVESGSVTVANALVKLLRLQQVTSGYLMDDERAIVQTGSEKAELLHDVLDDLAEREPVVVFCRFTHDLDIVRVNAADLGRTSSELSGRRNELAQWQAGETDVIAVQIQAGGVGIDLSRAHYGIYYSLGFSLGDYEQSLARIRRPTPDGSKPEGYVYVHLLAEDTVDLRVYKALRERKAVVESILAERGKGKS